MGERLLLELELWCRNKEEELKEPFVIVEGAEAFEASGCGCCCGCS
jgi:hypothetical protein